MPRAERLSTRIETLLETVFDSPSDPFSLYWDIAARVGPGEIALSQKTIRRMLKERGHVSPETAILVACLMNLGGFPPQRILHFISVYIPGGIRLSLFELAVAAIFFGEPPVPASLLYDLTQYTYLEKRLLVRKSIEISDRLAHGMDPRVLLFLYLLALRDDLSNEHVQLIALVLKRTLPSRELRGRIGSASVEEYGEIARAVRNAEERSLDLEMSATVSRAARAFDRDTASYFLDKYFSDEAIAEARASAPELPRRPPPPRVAPPAAVRGSVRVSAPRSAGGAEREPVRPPAPARPPRAAPPARPRPSAPRRRASRASPATADAGSPPPPPAAAPPRARRRAPRGVARAAPRGSGLVALPTVLAAVVLAILLGVVPAGRSPRPPAASDAPAADTPAAPAAIPAPAADTPGSAPSSPSTMTYVVKPGDSLWKIFTSMQPGDGGRGGWGQFLDRTRSVNDLGDPNRLRPGRVLTLSVPR